ncbi:NAD-specific glutamate dehydrogenase [Blastococcus aggregatus]|uniref:NAD-specific glutamate dehydrogenase n=1 Tax=Blastococcus aggregatus TaxID=38502 RepID=A0A285VIF0_9ACTN|nr:NAD-specific glutamate dehydrogenase [Blastococcus aggregatus]
MLTHQRHPRGAADEHDGVEISAGQAGAGDRGVEDVHRSSDAVGDELVQFLPRDPQPVRGCVGPGREGQPGRGVLRQRLLRGDHRCAQLPGVSTVERGLGSQRRQDVGEQRVVDVLATPAGGVRRRADVLDLAAVDGPDHGGVQGGGSQVVHGDGGRVGQPAGREVVVGRGHGTRHHGGGRPEGGREQLGAVRPPGRGDGDDRPRRGSALLRLRRRPGGRDQLRGDLDRGPPRAVLVERRGGSHARHHPGGAPAGQRYRDGGPVPRAGPGHRRDGGGADVDAQPVSVLLHGSPCVPAAGPCLKRVGFGRKLAAGSRSWGPRARPGSATAQLGGQTPGVPNDR